MFRIKSMARQNEVIVIAPPEAMLEIRPADGYSTVTFASVDEFERWRRTSRPTLARYVRQAFESIHGCHPRRAELEWLCHQQRVPSVKELSFHASSRRSFFRVWKRDVPASPNEFLQLVRRLHAEDLLGRGLAEREVARVTGFRNVAAMRQAVSA
jgi:AraC-like DNA-binding protein